MSESSINIPGLDHAFLRHIGVEPETQRRIHGFYLPWFKNCKTVADLGCGDGDFVALLSEQGVQAIGVDSDPISCAEVKKKGLDVECQDVFEYLQSIPEGSLDGVFSAHLVEHLHYTQVMELIELSWRALKDEGVLVLTTPNVRSLYTHLESFYLHFGHISFYHPELLRFFMSQAGFSNVTWGENPMTDAPMWGKSAQLSRASSSNVNVPEIRSVLRDRHLPSKSSGILGKSIEYLKNTLARWIVIPFVDELNSDLDVQRTILNNIANRIDRPVECYVIAYR